MIPAKRDTEEITQGARRLRKKRWEEAQRYGPLTYPKLDVLDFVFDRYAPSSLADLGAAYRVDGGYSLYALDFLGAAKAIIIDTHPTERLLAAVAERPELEVIKGNFGDRAIADSIEMVDMVILFDVLLHQVAPDWDELFELYAHKTRLFVISNPQWLGPETIRLLDLGEEKYLASVPQTRNEAAYRAAFDRPDELHPVHKRPNRDVHHIWQWGITDDDLISRLRSLGFGLRYFQDHGYFWQLENFRNRTFVFEKAT